MARAKSLDERIAEYGFRTSCGCLLWLGQTTKSGYAKTSGIKIFDKSYDRVHRLILVKRLGRDLQPWEYATHKCDIPSCIEEKHIKYGTALTNNRETVARGRYVNSWGKTDKIIKNQIRSLYVKGVTSQESLGKQFGIHQCRVSQIIREKGKA